MTELAPAIDGKPSTEVDPNKGIQLDAHGDPIRQGTLMIEKESYERVIEGLKIAADASRHLVKSESANAGQWRGLAVRLDQARKICVQHAGLGLVMKEKETADVRGDPMNWRWARDRFRYGITQATGGCKQMATCHRSDFWWSKMATSLEDLKLKLRPKTAQQLTNRNRPKLILPGSMH